MEYLMQLFTGALGSVGFGLLFHINKRYIPASAIGGALGWLVYLAVSSRDQHVFVAMLTASFCVAVYAEILARVYGAPSTPFFVTAAIPLIPGSTLYYCMSALAEGDMAMAGMYGSKTFLSALGIAGGMAIAWCISDLTRKLKANEDESEKAKKLKKVEKRY